MVQGCDALRIASFIYYAFLDQVIFQDLPLPLVLIEAAMAGQIPEKTNRRRHATDAAEIAARSASTCFGVGYTTPGGGSYSVSGCRRHN